VSSPQCVVAFAGSWRYVVGPVMVEIRVGVCVLIRRVGMSTQVGGLGQFVFE
jgi:hypothetical protein